MDAHLEQAIALVAAGVLRVDPEAGKVWRIGRLAADGTVRRLSRRRRAENVGGGGYLRVTFRHGKAIRQVMAHRLIWAVAVGFRDASAQIDHINMRRRDNRISNLEEVSQSENIRRRYRLRAAREVVADAA